MLEVRAIPQDRVAFDFTSLDDGGWVHIQSSALVDWGRTVTYTKRVLETCLQDELPIIKAQLMNPRYEFTLCRNSRKAYLVLGPVAPTIQEICARPAPMRVHHAHTVYEIGREYVADPLLWTVEDPVAQIGMLVQYLERMSGVRHAKYQVAYVCSVTGTTFLYVQVQSGMWVKTGDCRYEKTMYGSFDAVIALWDQGMAGRPSYLDFSVPLGIHKQLDKWAWMLNDPLAYQYDATWRATSVTMPATI